MRICIACRKKLPKSDLVRLVCVQGVPLIDMDGKHPGRGANVCADMTCFENAVERHSFEKAWHVCIDPALWPVVVEAFKEELASRLFRKGQKNVVVRVQKETVDQVLRQP